MMTILLVRVSLMAALLACGGARQVSGNASNTYMVMNDNRCLPTTSSKVLGSGVVLSDLQCAMRCDENSACQMFMITTSTNMCTIYTAMSSTFYYANAFLSPGTCRIYSEGWAPVRDDFTLLLTYL